jgi:hypothetical protein
VNRSFNETTLRRFREIPSEDVLVALSEHMKADSTYIPVKDTTSRRWHVHTTRGDFEILTTGPKWLDTRAAKGGGGAIDLAMHVMGLPFVDAVKLLTKKFYLADRHN